MKPRTRRAVAIEPRERAVGAGERLLRDVLGEREVAYRVSGTVHFAEGLLRVLPFSSGGQLALR